MALFGKKKDELSDIPQLPPLDLSQVPSGPPLAGATQRLAAAEASRLTPGGPIANPQMNPTNPIPAQAGPIGPAGQLPPAPSPGPNNLPGASPYSLSPVPPQPAIPFMQPQVPMAPSAPRGPSDHVTLMTEDIEKIAEEIIDQKWSRLVGEVNEIKNWKEGVAGEITEFKNLISKIDAKIDSVQKAMISKVSEYNDSIKDVNVELKAMGQVFEKILPTFTDNVKKLSEITDRASSPSPAKRAGRPKRK